jgi:sec-independent protein translocase protein TatB
MFDFAWSEIALIGVVALIAIGPKDMPTAIKAVAGVVKKARRMAAEFQTHVDEMVREADLHEVRDQINEIRNFDLRGAVERAVDDDGSIRRTFTEDPFKAATPVSSETASAGDVQTLTAPESETIPPPIPLPQGEGDEGGVEAAQPAQLSEAPAFIPPDAAVLPPPAPAFIPPDVVRAARRASPYA